MNLIELPPGSPSIEYRTTLDSLGVTITAVLVDYGARDKNLACARVSFSQNPALLSFSIEPYHGSDPSEVCLRAEAALGSAARAQRVSIDPDVLQAAKALGTAAQSVVDHLDRAPGTP